jgi:hypothetical protein
MFEHLDDTRPLPSPTADEVAAVVGGGERLRRRTRRLRIAAVAVPTAAVVAAVAVVVGTSPFSRQSLPDPATSGSPAPGDRSVAPAGPFEAIVVRGTRLVAIDSTGRERGVRDLRRIDLTAADLEYAYISTAGILGLEPGGGPSSAAVGHVLVDLTVPGAAEVLVRGLFDQRTWSPDGTRLFTMGNHGVAVVIDAATGRQTEVDLHGGRLPGGGPSLIWSGDGTAIVVQSADSGQPLVLAPIDGGAPRPLGQSFWERGGRTMGPGGTVLQPFTCSGSAEGCPSGAVRLGAPDGDTTVLYSGQADRATLFGATLSSDGRSAFVLLGAPEPNTLLVARSDAALDPLMLATVAVSTTRYASLDVSPDDAVGLITTVTDPDAETFTVEQHLVPLDGNPPVRLDGTFAGWVPTSVVDQMRVAGY